MGFGGLFGLFGGYQTARDVMSVGGLLLGGVNAAREFQAGHPATALFDLTLGLTQFFVHLGLRGSSGTSGANAAEAGGRPDLMVGYRDAGGQTETPSLLGGGKPAMGRAWGPWITEQGKPPAGAGGAGGGGAVGGVQGGVVGAQVGAAVNPPQQPPIPPQAPPAAGDAQPPKKRTIALGLDVSLDDFARRHSAESWKQFAKDDPLNWKSIFLDLMNDPNNEVLFNLDGVDVMGGLTRASTNRGGPTDWELLKIFENKEWWPRIKWIKNGVEVAIPLKVDVL